MDKIKLLSKVLIIVFFLGLLGLSAVTALVFFFSALFFDETKGPEHVEKTEDHGIEFVAKTRNVTMDFPDLEIRYREDAHEEGAGISITEFGSRR